jgi:branched-chain amino acid transport system substrate-binding protein
MCSLPPHFRRSPYQAHPWRSLAAFAAAAIICATPVFAETLITVAGPTWGPHAERTRQIEAGARRAAENLNATAGTDFVIETLDDGCDDAKATGVARALVAKRVALVLGHPCANAAIAAAEIYGKSDTVFIATTTRHPALTEKRAGPSIFRIGGRDGKQGAAAARYIIEAFKGRTVAVVHDRTLYAKTIAEQTLETLKAAKIDAVTATVVGGDKEYARLVAKLKGASAVFYAGFPLEAGFILQALRGAGSDAQFIVSDSVATSEFTQSFGASVKGVMALLPHAPKSIEIAGSALGGDAALAYAAIETTASAMKRATASEPKKKIMEALATGWHQTVAGLIGFNEAGDANVPAYDVLEWDGAAWSGPSASPVSTDAR